MRMVIKYMKRIKNDKFNGKGTFKFNGDIYVGEFKNGNFYGNGIYKYKNGDIYEGEYKDNKRNGKGTEQ